MLKIYLPTGTFEETIINLFKEAGIRVGVIHKDSLIKPDKTELPLKFLPAQDIPPLLAMGKADLAITTSDVVKEFLLTNPNHLGKITTILELGICKTKLAAIISKESFPLVTTFGEFMSQIRKQGKTKIVIATEYPSTVKNYLARKGIASVQILVPYGFGRNWLLPPNPEADLTVEVVENEATLSEDNCQAIETVQENQAVIIAFRPTLEEASKRQRVEDFINSIRKALYKIKEREQRLKQAQLPLPELKAKPIPAYLK